MMGGAERNTSWESQGDLSMQGYKGVCSKGTEFEGWLTVEWKWTVKWSSKHRSWRGLGLKTQLFKMKQIVSK